MDLRPVQFLQPRQLVLEVVILNRQVLVLVKQVVDLELQLRGTHVLTTELIF